MFSKISMQIHIFSLTKMHLAMSSPKLHHFVQCVCVCGVNHKYKKKMWYGGGGGGGGGLITNIKRMTSRPRGSCDNNLWCYMLKIPFVTNNAEYNQISNINPDQIPKRKCFSSRLAVVFALFIEARCQVENQDIVAAISSVPTCLFLATAVTV